MVIKSRNDERVRDGFSGANSSRIHEPINYNQSEFPIQIDSEKEKFNDMMS